MSRPRGSLGARFWAKVDTSGGPDACWPWLARRVKDGYGRFDIEFEEGGKSTVSAHQVAYALVKGPLPEGLTIDHVCRHAWCCNPAHLEPKTFRANLLAGDNPAARNARKTHCVRGHPYDQVNTYWRKDGTRACKLCREIHRRKVVRLPHARVARTNRMMRELRNNWEPRYWPKVDTSGGPDACWPWLAFCDPDGFGQLRVGDTVMSAPRLAYYLYYGLPSARDIHNSCGNNQCCNPKHLFPEEQGRRVVDPGHLPDIPGRLTQPPQLMTKQLNDINLENWDSQEYSDLLTDSLWVLNRREDFGVHPSPSYHGLFTPEIPNQLLRRYTCPGEWVFDPMCGSGTTPIEALRLGRHCAASDLNLTTALASIQAATPRLPPQSQSCVVRTGMGDARRLDPATLLEHAPGGKAQFLLLHPPYWNIIRFSEDPRDLCNSPTLGEFLDSWEAVCRNVVPALAPGRFGALVVGDLYTHGEWIPLGWLCWAALAARGMRLKSVIVKDFGETRGKQGQQQLWRYRALAGGFYRFAHEYIYLFFAPETTRAALYARPDLQGALPTAPARPARRPTPVVANGTGLRAPRRIGSR